MLMPKRVKYRKVQRGRMTGTASRGNKVAYGEYGIQALEPGWITGNQIEAARVAMTRYTKRGGKMLKLLNSAVANAEHNNQLDAEKLYVSTCVANPGPTLKRGMPRAKGSYNRILKRTTHITIGVSEKA